MVPSGLLGVHDTVPLNLCIFSNCLCNVYILNMSPPHQYPGTENGVDGLSKGQGSNEGEGCLLPDRQHSGSGLSVEGWRNLLQDPEWSCKEDLVQISPEWGNIMPRIPERYSKTPGRCLIKVQESSEVELSRPSQLQVIQTVRYSSSRSVCKQLGTQWPQYFSLDLSDRTASGGDALKER